MMILILFMGMHFHLWANEAPKVTIWHILEESELGIAGTTNINEFYCASDTYSGGDKLFEILNPDGRVSWRGTIRIPSSGFDCANKIMTNDFKSTILAEQFPFITMEFIELFEKDKLGTKLTGDAIVTLAEVSKCIEISCQMKKEENGMMRLIGSHTFLFSDFGLEPPRKFFGAVQVNNKVTVDFIILLKSSTVEGSPDVII